MKHTYTLIHSVISQKYSCGKRVARFNKKKHANNYCVHRPHKVAAYSIDKQKQVHDESIHSAFHSSACGPHVNAPHAQKRSRAQHVLNTLSTARLLKEVPARNTHTEDVRSDEERERKNYRPD